MSIKISHHGNDEHDDNQSQCALCAHKNIKFIKKRDRAKFSKCILIGVHLESNFHTTIDLTHHLTRNLALD